MQCDLHDKMSFLKFREKKQKERIEKQAKLLDERRETAPTGGPPAGDK